MSIQAVISQLKSISVAELIGRVEKVSSAFIETNGPMCTVGDICEVEGRLGQSLLAQVVMVDGAKTALMPLSNHAQTFPGARVRLSSSNDEAVVGDVYAGRLVDGLGQALDGKQAILSNLTRPLNGLACGPLQRSNPNEVLPTGVRVIDGLLTLGKGQRVGVFAASGVGKTTLLNQLSHQIECDRCVICHVGERGREIESLWNDLNVSGEIDKYTLIAATSDVSAALRVRSVYQALAIAEYWSAQGEHVVLLIDSITRFAMALREIGLAAGEPPTLRAFTPNVFDALPKIVERCGASKSGGAITAVMSVLSETDDVDDPIVEAMKSLLDGHIVLSRTIAEQGRYPAINVRSSISRLSSDLMDDEHSKCSRKIIELLSTYEDARMMIDSGIYKTGTNKKIDLSVNSKPEIEEFMRQKPKEKFEFEDTLIRLTSLVAKAA